MAKPAKRVFEAEVYYQARLKDGEPKRLFERETYFVVRTKSRCVTERDGRIAARCDEYPDRVGYGTNENEAKASLLRAITETGS